MIELLKKFIKKYFSSIVYFYGYLGNRIFSALFLTISVSFLDGLGLAMFFPLLKVIGDNGEIHPDEMGPLGIIIEGFDGLGIPVNLISVLLVMVGFFILKGVMSFYSNVYWIKLNLNFIRKTRANLLKLLNNIEFKHFVSADVGRIQNIMTAEVERISSSFQSYFRVIGAGLTVIVYMSFAFISNMQFALLVAVGGLSTNFLYRIIYKHTKGASHGFAQYNNIFQGQIIQFINHFKYLKATAYSKQYGERLNVTINQIEASRKRMGILSGISNSVKEPILIIIISIIIFIQVYYFGGAIGTILISLLFFYRALTTLMGMQVYWSYFLEVSGSMENMKEFQEEARKSQEKDGNISIKKFEDKIEFKDVNFSYGESKIIKDANLIIPKNTTCAFVGESGSGKTTMANLITGILIADDGEVRIDGNSLKTLKREDFQRRIGYVSQDPVIFSDTIYNNVSLWAPKTPENLKRFYQSIAYASIDLFIDKLSDNLDTLLGNNGINLSGGQKQRISIARELFKDIDILILDEATSALDSETEKEIQYNIDALQGYYTIIIIAHRLSTIKNADQIVFMDDGKIIDVDNFETLLARQERFKKMVALQEL